MGAGRWLRAELADRADAVRLGVCTAWDVACSKAGAALAAGSWLRVKGEATG